MIKNIFYTVRNAQSLKNVKWLSILMKKHTFLSLNNHVDNEEKNIGKKQRIHK